MTNAQVHYREQPARSILRQQGGADPWFLARYGMNLYRGCEHGCTYCDGRAERYFVEGDFSRDIVVKVNALELLAKALERLPEPGFLMLGGGVSDAYQPAEARYALARGALRLAARHRLPVHVLTKATLVARDLDLLEEINIQSRAILSVSIQTADEKLRRCFEPGAAPLDARWALLREAKRRGLATGVMLMPVLPGLTDQLDAIERVVARAGAVGVDFVCTAGLTLRPGVQREAYLASVQAHAPALLAGYHVAYRDQRRSGAPDPRYLARLEQRFFTALNRHGLPGRPPRRLFTGLLPLYTELAVLLEHQSYARRRAGLPGPDLGRAGWSLQRWAQQELAAHRGRAGWSHQTLERIVRRRVADGTLARVAELPDLVIPLLQDMTRA